MITIENKKLFALLSEKNVLVNGARRDSSELETIANKIIKYQDKEKAITAKVEPKELTEKVKTLGKQVEGLITEIEAAVKEIEAQKLAAIPEDIKQAHMDLMKQRENKERERNKKAIKIQKIKDKVVPIIQKEVKPLLKEYEDIETAELQDGKIVIKTFNHLENWKTAFRNKK